MCTKSSFCSAEILPSVLSADFAHLGDQLQMIRETGVKKIHFDIMDGIFVPSIALGFPVLASTRKATNLYLDVHLMVQDPGRYVEEAARCGADSIGVIMNATAYPDLGGPNLTWAFYSGYTAGRNAAAEAGK